MAKQALAVLVLLSSTTVWAKPNAVAVLDIQGTGVEPELLPTLTEVLTVEIDALGIYKVIAGRDVQAMLGFERQKDMMGCTDAACLAEIGGALGVDRIVATHIGRVGSTYVVNIKLINIRMADTEARVYETVRGEVDALIDTVKKSVHRLLGEGSKAGEEAAVSLGKEAPKAARAASEPVKTPEAAGAKPAPKISTPPAKESKVAKAPADIPAVEAKSEGRHVGWLPITLWSAGAVALGGAALVGISAKDDERKASEKTPDGNYAFGSQRAAEDARRQARISNILLGVGVLAAGGGVLAWLFSGPSISAPAQASLVPTAGPDGVGLALCGRY